MTTLREDLQMLVNKHSREIESNTPDFILADIMYAALVAFEHGVKRREDWYDTTGGTGKLPDGPLEVPPAASTKTEVESAPTIPAPVATPLPLVPFIDPNPSLSDDDHDCEDGHMVDSDPGVPF